MIVMKFGGTSNEDAASMKNVVRIVREHLARTPRGGHFRHRAGNKRA